ncbi:peptidoglycan D,D-transpeptidase FtsI family protein [Novosphingopyxis iocasae]|uniref:peptidoglycan D,D-transpeptidase FtsI family protein n=1 Tax=Novosphingopyxis iocasae TaxID=2762729 RepID=UPI0016514484
MTAFAATNPTRMRLGEYGGHVGTATYQRLMILALIFTAAVLLIVLRLGSFAIFENQKSYSAISSAYVPERGDIVDRNGIPLARTIAAYAIWVKPDEIRGDKRQLANQLQAIFPDEPAGEFYAKLTGKRPTYLRRRALPREVSEVHALGEIGIEFPREPERLYPEYDLAAHVLGFTDMSGHGRMGMERVLEKRLTDPNLRGEPVALSIDSRVQGALRNELMRAMTSTHAIGAAGVVLDANTGEIVALSSLPSFNPNKLDAEGVKNQANGVTQSVYELGSTFKPITVAAALDAGTVRDLSRRYDATAPLKIAGFKIHDDHPMGRWINVPEALVNSSNIVTARIADDLGRERMEKTLRSLDFDKRPEIEIAEKGLPIWPKDWGRLTNMTIGYGHGIAVTPLHLATAYASLVNGGIYRPSTLLKVDADKEPKGRRVFSAATSARMRQLLRMIVLDGTGRNADAEGFRIGGKTGSAEKPRAGGYAHNSLVSTFAAAFPMDNPQYVVVVSLDEPQGTAATSFQRTAGWVAAPIVKRLVPRIGPMLGVLPDTGRDVDVSELMPLLWRNGGDH